MAGLSPLERGLMLAGTITTLAGCATPAVPTPTKAPVIPQAAAPQATMTALSQDIACLTPSDTRKLEDCANRVDYQTIEPRINKLSEIISDPGVSEKSQTNLSSVLLTIMEMQKARKIRWYIYRQKGDIGYTQKGRSRIVLPVIGQDFFVAVVLPQDQPDIEADRLGVDFHELFHAVRAYERFRQGADPATDQAPIQEEYDAEYYELFIEKIARLRGMRSKDISALLQTDGIDLAEVVYMFDGNHIGPESKIYQYLSDLRIRFILQREVTRAKKKLAVMPNDQEAKKDLQKAKDQIKEIDNLWNGFPASGSADSNILRTIKSRKDLFDPSFFPTSQQGRWGGTSLVDHRYRPDTRSRLPARGVVFAGTTKGVRHPRFVTRAPGRRA
ncbi:hypothetical protein MUP32_00905 [Candidatus Microgenomates bacterium]|nr:hypothetical protein [Candidatus Microgenomates bacterium]